MMDISREQISVDKERTSIEAQRLQVEKGLPWNNWADREWTFNQVSSPW